MALVERFLDKVEVSEHGCWIWKACKDARGYGRFNVNNTGERAHRVSYEIHKGPIPEGLVIDHVCRNHACVNPGHLEAVTQRVNVLRGEAPSSINAAKVVCKHGHVLNQENTYTNPKTHYRTCRACRNRLSNQNYRRSKQVS